MSPVPARESTPGQVLSGVRGSGGADLHEVSERVARRREVLPGVRGARCLAGDRRAEVHPLGKGVLPGGAWGDEDLADPHVLHAPCEGFAVDRVAIPEEVLRGRLVGEGFDDLLGGLGGRRVIGDVDVEEFTAIVAEHHEGKEQAEGERRHDEEVDGHDVVEMGLQEDAPRWRWAARPPLHVFGDGEFAGRR